MEQNRTYCQWNVLSMKTDKEIQYLIFSIYIYLSKPEDEY